MISGHMADGSVKIKYEDIKSLVGKEVRVVIDWPLGSKRPQHGFLYETNYGYVEGIIAPDGEELDAYVVGVFEPLKEFSGRCIAIIHRTNDNDDKLVVAPDGKQFTDEQIRAFTEFQEKFFKSVIVR
jgi:inorganic pyrophosphatase